MTKLKQKPLTKCKRTSLISMFEIESVAVFKMMELNSSETCKCWSKSCFVKFPFRNSTNKQINIIPMSIRTKIFINDKLIFISYL